MEATRETVGQAAAVGSVAADPGFAASNIVNEEPAGYETGNAPVAADAAAPTEKLITAGSEPVTASTYAPEGPEAPADESYPVPASADADPAAVGSSSHGEGTEVVAVFDDDPDATWYVRPPSGGQYGPASSDILRKWIGEGRVASTALLWRDGWPQWRDASEALPELAHQLPKSDSAASSAPSSPSSVTPANSNAASPSPQFSGEANIGADRRSRSMRRVLLIGILTALAATLIGVLVVVLNR